ncbi:MAG: hypothetical protein HY327_02630 [Chloroflexi bacterium]|nr:hypothetical protein [Chloroflexota bacterium]
MEFEFAVNAPGGKDAPSMAEIAWSTGDIRKALADVPPIVPPQVRREFQRLLQPWHPGRYVESYRRSGGILNLFTPPWGEKQDESWNNLLAEWKARTFADDRSRRVALAELEQQWNNTPHPFFAGLTPAQVMIGGGPQEAKLADEFLAHMEQTLAKQTFEGEGDGLVKTLLLLRGWQVEPQPNGQTPMQIILAERSGLLVRRAHSLSETH